jgi:hypothetical protein
LVHVRFFQKAEKETMGMLTSDQKRRLTLLLAVGAGVAAIADAVVGYNLDGSIHYLYYAQAAVMAALSGCFSRQWWKKA